MLGFLRTAREVAGLLGFPGIINPYCTPARPGTFPGSSLDDIISASIKVNQQSKSLNRELKLKPVIITL